MTRRAAPALLTILLGSAALASLIQGCGDDEDGAIDGAVRDSAVDARDGGGGAGTGGRRANAAGAGGRRATPRAGEAGNGKGGAGTAWEDSGASGSGGRRAADGGSAGRSTETAPPSNEEGGCPALDFGGLLVLPSCCTSRRMCGVDTSMVGGPGCLDLATAADRARMSGASVIFPAPRACEPEPESTDADGGGLDDAGSE